MPRSRISRTIADDHGQLMLKIGPIGPLASVTTSSLMESQIKEFHRRLKGSEKFWNPSNAEAMLQLLCWSLRNDGPTLADYLATRPGHPFRCKPLKPLKPPPSIAA